MANITDVVVVLYVQDVTFDFDRCLVSEIVEVSEIRWLDLVIDR